MSKFILLAILSFFGSCQSHPTRSLASVNDLFSEFRDLECSPEPSIKCSGLFSPKDENETQIALLTNGEASLAARLKTLREAKRSIYIQALVFKADEAGVYISKILMEKKKAGLDVKLIVDTFSNLDLPTQNLFYELKMAGIEVEGYEAAYLGWVNELSHKDPERPNKRFHDKLWIVDGNDPVNRVAIVGGMNIANEYFRVGRKAEKIWRDQDFLVKGNIISDMVKTFERNYIDQKKIKDKHWINTDVTWAIWRKNIARKFRGLLFPKSGDAATIKQIQEIERRASSLIPPLKTAKAQFFQNRPRYSETFIQQVYTRSFSQARQKIVLVNAYFIPNKELIESLKQAARNGAEVTIITNSPETNDLPEMAYASRYTYKDLLSVNRDVRTKGRLRIYEWQGHRYGEGTIHAKFAVIDEHTIIGGSYNLDPRSEKLNSETILVFENEIMAKALTGYEMSVDIKKSRLISDVDAENYYNPRNPPDVFKLLIWNGLKGML